MSVAVIALVVCAAAVHASWNLISKKAAGGSPTDFVFAYRLVSTVLYAPWVAWVLWAGGMHWSGAVILFVVLSSVLHLGYSLALQWGYSAADLSVVYPVARGTGPLLSSMGAFLLLAEPATSRGLLGIAAVVCGIALIATNGRWQQLAELGGVRWGVFIGLFIATYTLADAYAVKVLLVVPVVLDWFAALGNAVLLAPRTLARPRAFAAGMRGRWRYALAVGLLSPLSYILVLYAYQLGGNVSVVAPLREMSMMMGTIAGFVLLRERATWARLAGCAVIIVGVVLLAG